MTEPLLPLVWSLELRSTASLQPARSLQLVRSRKPAAPDGTSLWSTKNARLSQSSIRFMSIKAQGKSIYNWKQRAVCPQLHSRFIDKLFATLILNADRVKCSPSSRVAQLFSLFFDRQICHFCSRRLVTAQQQIRERHEELSSPR